MAKPSHDLHTREHVHKLALSGLEFATWYDKARGEIETVCTFEEWNVSRFSDTLAILSPRVAVRRNVRATLAYVGQNVHFPTTMRNVRTSLRTYENTGIIGGNKVPFFARALRGDRQAITLDTWMAYALQNVETPSIKLFSRKATFASACKLVQSVSGMLGLCPRDTQATIWAGTFRQTGRIPPFYPILEEYERWLAYDREFPLSGVIGKPEQDEITGSEWIETVLADDSTDFQFGGNQF